MLSGFTNAYKSAIQDEGELEGIDRSEIHPSLNEEDHIAETLQHEMHPRNMKRSYVVANTLTAAIIQMWLLVTLFLPHAFVTHQETFLYIASFQEASFCAFILAISARFILRHMSHVRWRRLTKIMLVLAPLVGCFTLAATNMGLPHSVNVAFHCLADISFGAALGFAFTSWVRLFVNFKENVPVCIGVSLMLSAAGVLLLSLVPDALSTTFMMVVPLALLLALNHFDTVAHRIDEAYDSEGEEVDDHMEPPRRLWLSLIAVGFVFGLSYGYVATSVEAIHGALWVCMAASMFLGLSLLGQFIRTKKNPGFTISLSLILSLACIGQGLVSIFQDRGLAFFFGILFAGQLLFTSVLLMQLPVIYKKKQTLRVFFQLWVVFYLAQFVGLLLRRFLLVDHYGFSFEVVSAAALVLLIVIMAFALRDNSIATAWEYLPIPQASRKLYAASCEAIQERYALTPRESEIMKLVARGRNGTFVQEKLFISKSTYQTHMRNLYKKLDIHSDQELIDLVEEEINTQRSREEN
jgi:DNA-binding CsgD family transcriptional regulator